MLRSLFGQRGISLTLRQFKPIVPLCHKGFSSTNIQSIILQQRQYLPYSSNIFLNQQRSLHVTYQRWHQATTNGDGSNEEQVADPKHQLLIGFTCKVCQVRSHHLMSKQAYTKGVVLIQCPECKNRHLIADNLGWFQDSKTNVEDLVKEKGEAIRKVVVDEEGNRLPVEHLMEWLPQITAEEEERIQEANDKAQKLQLEKEKENGKVDV